MEIELPYKAEYAKTGRAGCKGCKTGIAQGSLRIAAMVQSAFHDSKQPNWFHEDCFFKKQRPGSVGDIENLENLRFEDQERVKKSVAEVASIVLPESSKSGKKRSKEGNSAVKDFGIEYAKSGRAQCKGCEQKIIKDQVRIRKTVYDTEVGMKYGGQPLWHHVECFSQLRGELGWFEAGQQLPGFSSLKAEDKDEVKKVLPAIKSEDMPVIKKAKLETKDEVDSVNDKKQADLLKKQITRIFKLRDNVKEIKRKDIKELLEYNDQEPVVGDSEKLLDQVADMLAFGAIEPCPDCNSHQLLFNKSGYLCNGQLTEWTKCAKLITEPKRVPCKLPSAFKQKYSFLNKVPKNPGARIIQYIPPSASIIAKNVALKKDDELNEIIEGIRISEQQTAINVKTNLTSHRKSESDEKALIGSMPKVKRKRPALYNLPFAYVGPKEQENEVKNRILKLGGIFSTKINEETIAVISSANDVKRMGRRMQKVKESQTHVVPIEYLDSVESDTSGAISYISGMTLCDWGTDPSLRIPKEEAKSSKSKSIYTKSVSKSQTLKVKDGLAVDPDSGLEDIAHVYAQGKNKYNVVLGLTDIQRNKNSYYKLQLLESDAKNKFWVFRSWGRIGTTIGGNKVDDFPNLIEAIKFFKELYLEKTANKFDNRDNFQKAPGRMYPIDIDYTEDAKVDLSAEHNIKSKLDPPVQNLIKLLFDVNNMKQTMMEFHLDMEKMPLGKLSQKQIQSAYKVLTEIYELIQKEGSNSAFIDATNRFYTLIPHNFGIATPPLLDTSEEIEKLRQMLDSLLEIEYAYNLIQTEDSKEESNPLDKHYDQLKTKLEPVPKDSDEFNILKQYVQNTHAETHKMYELEVVDIFKVSRQGEARRFKPFKKLHNRKLLWHGSRLTNFAGILSHGLKIAPPEAPVTGYMFGKGIYFADMVSKSANYCCTSKQNSTGLLLLSEVALGDMMECTEAKYVTKLPKDKHSCFGRGRTMPNPKESKTREDGVEIPLGKPQTVPKLKSSLLYNEYIVYDIAQVNIQYLFRMNFNYKF